MTHFLPFTLDGKLLFKAGIIKKIADASYTQYFLFYFRPPHRDFNQYFGLEYDIEML